MELARLVEQPSLRRCADRRAPGGVEFRRVRIQVGEDLLDDGWILNARDDAHRPTAGRAGLDIDPDQIAWSDLEPPQAGPKGAGQDARSNTRFRRCAQVIAACRSVGLVSSRFSVLAC